MRPRDWAGEPASGRCNRRRQHGAGGIRVGRGCRRGEYVQGESETQAGISSRGREKGRIDGRRWEYHVVRLRHLAVAAVVNDRQEVLMMWRHRFIADSWAWELPMGLVEELETPEEAGAREVLEETGWRPGLIKPLVYAEPDNGITDSTRCGRTRSFRGRSGVGRAVHEPGHDRPPGGRERRIARRPVVPAHGADDRHAPRSCPGSSSASAAPSRPAPSVSSVWSAVAAKPMRRWAAGGSVAK